MNHSYYNLGWDDRAEGKVDLSAYAENPGYTEGWDAADTYLDSEHPYFVSVDRYLDEEEEEPCA